MLSECDCWMQDKFEVHQLPFIMKSRGGSVQCTSPLSLGGDIGKGYISFSVRVEFGKDMVIRSSSNRPREVCWKRCLHLEGESHGPSWAFPGSV